MRSCLKNSPTIRLCREAGKVWLIFILIGFNACTSEPIPPGSDAMVWGRQGLDQGRFIKPRAITIDEFDRIYIVDTTSRIQVFDRDGKFLRSWRTPVCLQGKPCGLSISHDGLLMVCDTHYFRVLFYTYEGELVPERGIGGVNGRGPGEFGFLTDVVQDSQHNYYVSEYGDYDRIQKFSPTGEYLTQWGEHGTEPGQFLRPQSMAIDKQDHLWIADASNHRVQIYDVAGEKPKLLRVWGEQGSAPGKLSYPYQIWLDEDGTVFVCEFGNHRVQAFTPDGESLAVWGGAGREPGQLHQPWAMCRDSRHAFHILDSYNHRVQRFMFEPNIDVAHPAASKSPAIN